MLDSTLPQVTYLYTGPAEYTFDFRALAATHIVVSYIDSTGGVTILEKDTDYSVSLNPDGTGSVTTLAPVDTDGRLEIRRSVPYEQTVDYVNGSAFDMTVLEASLDWLVMLCQQNHLDIVSGSQTSNFRGDWAVDTDYYVNQIVVMPNGNSYVARVSHTSDATDYTIDLALGYWALTINATAVQDAQVAAEAAQAAAEAAQLAAETAETNAETAETNAKTAETNAETARDLAQEWAQQLEDTHITGLTGLLDYSAYHWAMKAAESVAGFIDANADPAKYIAFATGGVTKLAFCQATAPLGWTQDVSKNDAFLRVVSTAGGGTGGSASAATLAHTHTGPSHTHTMDTHLHRWYNYTGTIDQTYNSSGSAINLSDIAHGAGAYIVVAASAYTGMGVDGYTSLTDPGDTGAAGTGNTGSTSIAPKYVNMIICSLD